MTSEKPFRDKKAPSGKPDKLTPDQKQAAKERATKAGRPYPNLIDNAAIGRTSKKQ